MTNQPLMTTTPRRQAAVRAAIASAMLAITPAALGAPSVAKKASIDQRLSTVERRAQIARGREVVLSSEVGAYTARARILEVRLAPLAARREVAETNANALKIELGTLTSRLKAETEGLKRSQVVIKDQRAALGARLRELYRRGTTSNVVLMLEAPSLTDALAANTALKRISARDRDLIHAVQNYASNLRTSRARIVKLRSGVIVKERRAATAAATARAATVQLERQTRELKRARDGRRVLLRRVGSQRAHLEAEAKDLRQESMKLANEIVRASGGTVTVVGTPSSAGFIWPVSAPITSGFGFRWGRMHEGIDLAVSQGTPLAASAAGRVIVAGWQGGYGNLVVVDHGNGLTTAYAHQSRIAVSVGQSVAQGSIVGLSGNTGNSTGPHLHFEVRINGRATQPLNYL